MRELANAIERACIIADATELQPRDLGFLDEALSDTQLAGFDFSGTLNEATDRAVRMIEQRKIADALTECDGNKTRAAEVLGISYKTLLTKIKDYNLQPND